MIGDKEGCPNTICAYFSEYSSHCYRCGALDSRVGQREVVEWIEQQGFYSSVSPCECLTNNQQWQAKLKEWGID